MKKIGRFIAVLAALGLLLAVLPIIPAAGAVAGTVTLTGGVTTDSVQWFSAVSGSGNNVVTISVADADKNVSLSLTKGYQVGTAWYDVVGVGGTTTYMVHNAPIADRNNDGEVNNLDVSVRDLHGSMALSVSGVGGAEVDQVVLSNNAPLAAFTMLASTTQTVGTVAYVENLANTGIPAQLLITCGDCDGAANLSVVITGTKFVVATQTATAAQSETVAITDIATTGTTVDFWRNVTQIAVTVSGANATGIKVEERSSVGVSYKYAATDHITGRTTLVSSAYSAAPIALTLDETLPGSGIFQATATLTTTIGNHSTTAVTAANVYVTDGALLTVTYNDQDPVGSIVKTARADLKAPTIELVGPTYNSYTNVSSLTFIVKVTDEASADGKASGLDTTVVDDIVVKQAGGTAQVRAAATPLLIGTNSFQVSYSETITLEGLTKWWLPLKDKVGNAPKFTSGASPTDAVRGAGDPADPTAEPAGHNPFKVTIDTAAPTVTANEVQTGGKLVAYTDCNLTTVSTSTIWCADATARKAVTVKFGLGTGTAPLDSATLSASAWTVAGSAPSSAAMTTAGDTVVLTLAADQATDAAPKVELVTAGLKDKAGNSMATLTGTAAPTAVDKLRPVLDVAVSTANTKDKVTVTVTSSELLGAAPTVKLYTKSTLDEGEATLTVTATTDLKTWTAEKSATTAKATKWWVKVVGTDPQPGGNEETRGEGTPSTDVITFQTDKVAPLATVTPTTVEEGSIFIRVVFDDNEGYNCTQANVEDTTHACSGKTASKARGDTSASPYTDAYKKVTLTKATLTNKTTLAVETITIGATGFNPNKAVTEYVLVKSLSKAKYDVYLEYVDEAGNTGTKTQEINVTARVLTVISLTPGNNFISLPGAPVSSGINDIIAKDVAVDLVVGYDPSLANPWLTSTRDSTTGLFVGDLKSLEAGKGYIVRATAFVDLEVDILTAAYNVLPGVNMVKGNAWNLIGPATRTALATTVDADSYLAGTRWSVCVTFNPDPGAADKGWTSVRPDTTEVTANNLMVKRGYFCWFQADGTIVQQ